MYNSLLDSLKGLEGPVDQMLPALNQHLDKHIVGNQLSVNKLSQKVVFDLGSCRKTDLNFLKAKLHQHIEHLDLLFHNHGLDESLVAVAQIHAAPDGSFLAEEKRLWGHTASISTRKWDRTLLNI